MLLTPDNGMYSSSTSSLSKEPDRTFDHSRALKPMMTFLSSLKFIDRQILRVQNCKMFGQGLSLEGGLNFSSSHDPFLLLCSSWRIVVFFHQVINYRKILREGSREEEKYRRQEKKKESESISGGVRTCGQPFHNFRASISADRRFRTTQSSLIGGLWGFKIVKARSGKSNLRVGFGKSYVVAPMISMAYKPNGLLVSCVMTTEVNIVTLWFSTWLFWALSHSAITICDKPTYSPLVKLAFEIEPIRH